MGSATPRAVVVTDVRRHPQIAADFIFRRFTGRISVIRNMMHSQDHLLYFLSVYMYVRCLLLKHARSPCRTAGGDFLVDACASKLLALPSKALSAVLQKYQKERLCDDIDSKIVHAVEEMKRTECAHALHMLSQCHGWQKCDD